MPDVLTYDDLPADIQRRLDSLYNACDYRRWAEAIPGLTEVVDAYPGYINAVFVLGTALRAIGDGARANAHFLAAARIAPDDPRICLGLAWERLDAGDFAGAEAIVQRALATASSLVRGDLLAILGRAAEADDREVEAAQRYLEAYEAGTRLGWLEAHCRLAGVDYVLDDVSASAPWPVGMAERCWMYSEITAALAAAARAADPDVPLEKLMVRGCDNTARATAAWAMRAGVDRALLYQALASRGGYCDCEVLMNAASEDDDVRGLTLLVGSIDGEVSEVADALQDFLTDDAPAPGATMEPAGTTDDYLGVYLELPDGRIPQQVTDSGTLGELLRLLAASPPTRAQLRLLAGFVREPPTLVSASPSGEGLRFERLPDDEPTAALEARWPGLASLVAQLRAADTLAPPDGPG
ncbi:MAG: DUF2695 domain-containing protein [Kofleriaceae bacterium]|nr:DUF2695 domain-containing protein [Kofleriaceae bacterium]